jgi:hypothetical protein
MIISEGNRSQNQIFVQFCFFIACSCPNGNSYIKRTITKNNIIKRADDDISLEFKTTQANGLFLFAKGGLRDFVLLKLQNGNIVFEVDLGTGMVIESI